MYDTHRDLVDALAASPDTLTALMQDVDDALARRARGGDEGWSVVEVLGHLRDAEARTVERVDAIRDTDEPSLAAYDQEAWAVERNYAAGDPAAALAAFLASRARLVSDLRALAAEGWDRVGHHAEAGRITIENLVLHNVSHDAQHLGQIARAVRDARSAS